MSGAILLQEQAQAWASRIAESFQKSAAAIVDTGRLLSEAKAELEHGQFAAMIEAALPFSARTAQRLMKIAADPRLSNATHVSHLPPSWGTLYEITKLDDATFEARIADGTICPDMERRDILQISKKEKRAARETELAVKQRALPQKKYGVILADPEWKFKVWSEDGGMDRSADNHYPCSELEDIKARDVAGIAAENCVLFLWATAPMLPHALEVMKAWGFVCKSHAIWRKNRIGTGYWFRNAHEILLVGTRGKIPAPAMGEQWESVIDGEVGAHSAKPDWQYELIETYFPNLPKIELNARRMRPGWDAWGYEAPENKTAEAGGSEKTAVLPCAAGSETADPAQTTAGEACNSASSAGANDFPDLPPELDRRKKPQEAAAA